MQLTIGQLAKSAGVKLTTIRFYERRGLIPEPHRAASGYRQYTSDMVTRIHFIKNAQAIGFTLEEISELLELKENTNTHCKTIKARAAHKIELVDNKIQVLKTIKRALQDLHDGCRGHGSIQEGCTILDALGSEKITQQFMSSAMGAWL